jgi:hypothetical protein
MTRQKWFEFELTMFLQKHGQSWSTMVNHGQSWSIMVNHGQKHGQKTWSKAWSKIESDVNDAKPHHAEGVE